LTAPERTVKNPLTTTGDLGIRDASAVEPPVAVRVEAELSPLAGTGLTFVTGVPDSVFKGLIAALERHDLDVRYLRATREDNAIGLAVGAYLAGERPLVFMESAGVGTALDALTSLAMSYGIPLVVLIAWAGYKARDVTHHNAIGAPLGQIIAALGLPVMTIAERDLDAPVLPATLAEAQARAHEYGGPSVILVVPAELEDGVGS